MQYYLDILILVGLFTIVNVSFNLVLGYAGLFSVGHGIFYGLGAFISALLAIHLGISPWLSIPIAMILTAVISLLIALPSLRVSEYYFSIAALGFQVVMVQVLLNVDAFGGASGLGGIPQLMSTRTVGGTLGFVGLVFAIAILTILASLWIVRLPFGRVLQAIREDEAATELLGKNVTSYKLQVFMISAAMAALAGGLYAHYYLYLNATSFDIPFSIQLVSMVLVGGMGTIMGPVVGSALLVILPEALRFVPLPAGAGAPLRVMIYAATVLVFLYVRPNGILGGRRRDLQEPRSEASQSADTVSAADSIGNAL
jgi:branched-chain amino acid transport system permease protein